MKANPRVRALRFRNSRLALVPPALALSLAACVPAPKGPAPAPVPASATRPAPPPAPLPPAPPVADWRDAPVTPGDWQWSTVPGGTQASFAGGQLTLRCDTARRAIVLTRAAPSARQPAALAITTSTGTRAVNAVPASGALAATLPAHDPLLDAMAFSRGRFAVAANGLPLLVAPSWTEVSRVVEDCR